MKKARGFSYTAQALILCVLCFFIAQAWSLIDGYRVSADQIRRQEIWTAQMMAGAILEEQPELESVIAAALVRADTADERQKLGADILRKYGYGHDMSALENVRYSALEKAWTGRILVFIALSAGIFILAGAVVAVMHSAKHRRLTAVLEAYLSGDYAFASGLDPLYGKRRAGRDGRLSDLLKQLGSLIAFKNLTLVEEQERTKSLVTDISHQLKTPIASLKTCFSLYLEADNDGERVEFLQRSQLQMDKLEDLTGALVNISRLETAMIDLHPRESDLRAVLVRAVESVYDKAFKKNIGIDLCPFGDMALPLDAKWTAEAIANVLDNAIKYSPPQTVIRISVEPRVNFARIEIADEGIGIPREERARVFQRFYRGGHAMVKAAEGSGVGLYLSRMILEKQGGGISVKSGAAGGSVFVIQLRKQ